MMSTWRVLPADPGRAERLARTCGLHPLTAQLLLNRRITTAAEARQFFQPDLKDLGDPDRLPDMALAVSRLRRAIAKQEPILIFGDSDVDGLTASVILYETLQELGAVVRARQSNRIADGYGLPSALVRQIVRTSTKLVILVDCGTNQPEEIRVLAEQGIDTIVVDHHVPIKSWSQPEALINPHRTQGIGRELCSAGLAFRVAQVLFHEALPHRLAAFLDLAALGTLADYVPLLGDNRVIVAEGLARIVRSDRPGLQRLCEAMGTTSPEPESILKRLVPRLNASGRLGDPTAVWHLLRRVEEGRWTDWMASAESAHRETKELHRRILGEAQEQVNRLHFRDQYVVVVSGAGWHQGLMGPLASRLAERYGRPAIAIALDERRGVGSGRSVPVFDLLKTLRQCEDVLVEFGGHAQACGLSLRAKDLPSFRALVNLRAKEQIGREAFVRVRTLDLDLPLEAVERGWVEETARFAPFGPGNPRPTVAIRHLGVEQRSPHTAWLTDGTTRVRARGSFPGLVPGVRYDVAASAAVGGSELVLTVSDVKPSTEPSGPVHAVGSSYTRGSA